MCAHATCAMCGKVRLGLFCAWQEDDGEALSTRTGHVCYGCEDRTCNRIAAGASNVRWLDTISGCDNAK